MSGDGHQMSGFFFSFWDGWITECSFLRAKETCKLSVQKTIQKWHAMHFSVMSIALNENLKTKARWLSGGRNLPGHQDKGKGNQCQKYVDKGT